MKKYQLIIAIITLISTFSISSTNAQWTKHHYIDEFGDDTKDTYESFVVEGTFTNSATTNSRLKLKFIKDPNGVMLDIYEYGNRKAVVSSHKFLTVKIKKPNLEVVSINSVYYHVSGSLVFSEGRRDQLLEIIKPKGTYQIYFKYPSGYGSGSTYKAKFTIY